MLGVKPYIGFNGNCEEALNFYKDSMDAEIKGIFRYGDSPMAGHAPADKVMHATLQVGDTFIMAADSMSPDHPITVGNNVSLAVSHGDAARIEKMFSRMSEGGQVTMPLQETFWAERFGTLVDKFGINWMFNCEKPRGNGQHND